MQYEKHKYIGLLGLLALIGLKGLDTGHFVWCLFFVNYIWFTFFYEKSLVYSWHRKDISQEKNEML